MNLRVIVFSVLFTSLLMAEIFYPYRSRVLLRIQRWPGNLLLIFIDSLLLKLILPAGLFVVSIWASEQKIGFLNYFELQGVSPAQLEPVSYGEERPVVIGHDDSAWSQNRRVELRK